MVFNLFSSEMTLAQYAAFSEFFSTLVWAVMIAVVAWWFSAPIKRLIDRVKTLESKFLSLTLGPGSGEEYYTLPSTAGNESRSKAMGATTQSSPKRVKGDKYNWYWLGHDIMHVQFVLSQPSDSGQVYHALRVVMDHVKLLPSLPTRSWTDMIV